MSSATPSSSSREDFLALAVRIASSPAVPAPRRRPAAEREGVWCWHCCHPCGAGVTPIPLPVGYDDRTRVWKTKGAFCSFACAKAYNWDSGKAHAGLIGQLITLFRKHTTGALAHTVPAPPRTTLAVFGGTLSIDEFRAKSELGIVVERLPLKMVPVHQIVDERRVDAFNVSNAPRPDLSEPVVFAAPAHAVQNESLRLKRPKPMPSSSNTLARVMGLQIS